MLIFLKFRYQSEKSIRKLTIKIIIEKSQCMYIVTMGKWLNTRCQVRDNNIADLNFFQEYLNIFRITKPKMAAVIKVWTTYRFINMHDRFWREKLSNTKQGSNFPSSQHSNWFSVIFPLHVRVKTLIRERALWHSTGG